MAKAEDFNLNTVLSLQTEEFQKGVAAANLQAKQMRKNFKTHSDGIASDFGDLAKSVAGPLTAMFSVGAIVAFGEEAVKSANEVIKANKNLLFSVGGNQEAYNALYMQAEKLRETTGISDEAIKQIQQLGAGAGYSTDRIEKLTTASIQLSKKTGMDLQMAYTQLNVTLSGSVGRLKRLDPEFASLTTEQLKHGAAIDLVNSKYGGFAENSVTNLEKSKVAWTEFQKGVGLSMSPLTEQIAGLKTQFLELITPQNKLSTGMKEQALNSSVLIDSILSLKEGDAQRGTEIQKLIAMNPEYLSGLDAQKLTQTDLLGIQKQLNKEFESSIQLQVNAERIADVEKKKQANLKDLAAYDAAIRNKYMQQTGTKSTAGFNVSQLANSMPNQAGDVGIYKSGNGEAPSIMLAKYNTILKELNGNLSEENDIKKDTDIIDKKQKDYIEDLKKKEIIQEKALKNAKGKFEIEKATTALTLTRNLINANVDKPDPIYKAPTNGKEAKKALEERLKQTAKFIDEENKIIFEGTQAIETDSKQKAINELDNKLKLHLDLLSDYKAKTTEELKLAKHFHDKILEYDGLQRAALLRPVVNTPIGQLAKIVGGSKLPISSIPTETNLHSLITNIKEFAKSRELIDMMANSFDSLGMSIVGSMGLAASGIQGFAKAGLEALSKIASQFIATMLSESIAASITGAAESGAATGPAAFFTTPAFIAEAVGGIFAAFAAIPKFAEGGIVPGTQYHGDNIHAFVNSGEMILNSGQQSRLFSMLNSGISSGGSNSVSNVRFEIEGTKLVGILRNQGRKISKIG
jgi:hypothetical protein